jgi:hypothetical protein
VAGKNVLIHCVNGKHRTNAVRELVSGHASSRGLELGFFAPGAGAGQGARPGNLVFSPGVAQARIQNMWAFTAWLRGLLLFGSGWSLGGCSVQGDSFCPLETFRCPPLDFLGS